MEDLVEIYRDVLAGPYIHCLGDHCEAGERVLVVKVTNRRGLVPASIISGQPQFIKQIDDYWLRDVVCKLYFIENKEEDSKAKYMAKYFIKSAKTCGDDPEDISYIKKNDEPEVSFGDGPSVKDETIVRGHAKGLVSKKLLDKLDGMKGELEWLCGNSDIKGTRMKLRLVRPLGPVFSDDTQKIPTTHLTNMLGDCMNALVKRIFYKAKQLDQTLLETFKAKFYAETYTQSEGDITDFQSNPKTLMPNPEECYQDTTEQSCDDMVAVKSIIGDQITKARL